MSLMILKAFVCADIGNFLFLYVLVNMFGVSSKTVSTNVQVVFGFLFFVLFTGTVISGAATLFWWLL